MFPQTFSESAKEAAESQANYLILRTLEKKLPSELFQQVLDQLHGSLSLPKRIRWDGAPSKANFNEVKVSLAEIDESFLPRVLEAVNNKENNSSKIGPDSTKNAQEKNLSFHLRHIIAGKETTSNKNIYSHLNAKRGRFGKIPAAMVGGGRPCEARAKTFEPLEMANLDRMKTVFCHADFNTNEVSSIFNVAFDKSGKFIISGADDGVLKVWDRDSLTLQASLHGHQDFITDINVTPCNRFIVSCGNDANLIIWDLASCEMLYKLQHHTALINRILFFAPKNLNPDKNRIQTQFLFSCSDDGTVQMFDLTVLNKLRGHKTDENLANVPGQEMQEDLDEFRVRRSSRVRTQSPVRGERGDPAEPEESVQVQKKLPKIFNIQLIQSDYRPGTRNKKIDTLNINSSGLVVAGTNTGELFSWKVDFAKFAERAQYGGGSRGHTDLYRYLGQNKLLKNSNGIQFIEFSPNNDHLLLMGSTDGQIKVWNTEITKKDRPEMRNLDLENDTGRLKFTMDEKEGCIQYKIQKERLNDSEESDGPAAYEYKIKKFAKNPIEGSRVLIKNIKKCQCDNVQWSAQGRYVIGSITTQIEAKDQPRGQNEEEKEKEEICRIKIWDFVNETYIDDLARSGGFALKKNTWVLAPHPKNEEILITGSDGGQLLLWNLQTQRVIKRFTQCGVYSIDTYVMDNPLDGKFSPDGRAFLVGSQLGTISLFAHKSLAYQYESTRVQQFFPFDQERQKENRFEMLEKQPQICGFNMIPYETQPTVPLIGKFALQAAKDTYIEHKRQIQSPEKIQEDQDADIKQKPLRQQIKAQYEEFERGLAVSKNLGFQEELYYKDQTSLPEIPNVLGNREVDPRYMDSPAQSQINSQHSQGVLLPDDQNVLERELDIINNSPRRPDRPERPSLQDSENRRSLRNRLTRVDQHQEQQQQESRRPGLRDRPQRQSQSPTRELREPRATRNQGPIIPPSPQISGLSDPESSKDYHDPEFKKDSELDESSSHSEYGEQSYQEDSMVIDSRRRRSPRRRDTYQQDEYDRQNYEREQKTALDRQARYRQRKRRIMDSPNFQDDDSEMSGVEYVGANGYGMEFKQRRKVQQFGLVNDSDSQGNSMESPPKRRKLRRNNIIEEDENSFAEPISMDEHDGMYRRTRGQNTSPERQTRQNPRNRTIVSSSSATEEIRTLSRMNRAAKSKTQKKVGDTIGNEDESSSEQSYDNVSQSEDTSIIKPPEKGRMGVFTGSKPETHYQFIDNKAEIQSLLKRFPDCKSSCGICSRSGNNLIGPFVKYEDGKQVGEPLYFYQDCIEISQFSYFSMKDSQWVNIQEALDNLVIRDKYKCVRCDKYGASVQCMSCNRCFHGHHCSKMMTIDVSEVGKNKQIHPKNRKVQCFQCRNAVNFKEFEEEGVSRYVNEKHKDNYLLKEWKKLSRDHLLQTQQPTQQGSQVKRFTVVPQSNDLVYYFFQGHEDYMSQYSCFFFCGENLPRKETLPWLICPEIKKKNALLCRVASVDVEFPCRRAIKLLTMFGYGSTTVWQKPELIQSVKLEVITKLRGYNQGNPFTFKVLLIQNTLSDFMVLKQVFESKLQKYEQAASAAITGPRATFRTLYKDGQTEQGEDLEKNETVEIVNWHSPVEETNFANSYWKSVVCKPVSQERHNRGTGEMPAHRSTRQQPIEPLSPGLAQDQKRINFWEIQFDLDSDEQKTLDESLMAFTDMERSKLVDFFTDLFERKSSDCLYYRERVPEKVAIDYRSIIPADMYLNLIYDRLLNNYYRCQTQLFSDLDLIVYNAQSYNGDEHAIAEDCYELIESIKKKIRPSINDKPETALQKKIQLAQLIRDPATIQVSLKRTGKETAPLILRDMNQDQMEEQITQQYDQIRANGRGGTRAQEAALLAEEEKKEEPEPTPETRQKKIVIRFDRNLSPPTRNGAPAQSRGSERRSARHNNTSQQDFYPSGVSNGAQEIDSIDIDALSDGDMADGNFEMKNGDHSKNIRVTRNRACKATDEVPETERRATRLRQKPTNGDSNTPIQVQGVPGLFNGTRNKDSNLGRKRNRNVAQLDSNADYGDDESLQSSCSEVSGRLRRRNNDNVSGPNKRQRMI